MKSDDVIAEALASKMYEVDATTGTIYGQRGRALACPPDSDGYRTLTMVTPIGRANVRAHRVVAASAWGIDAIRGRQVGHRDCDRANNALANLWLPVDATEHYRHDNKVKPKPRAGAPPRASWDPCVRCDVPDGPKHPGRPGGSPARVSGARYGITGELCWRCYRALHERERRRRQREGADDSATVGESRSRRR